MKDEPWIAEHSSSTVISVVDENCDFVAEKFHDFVSSFPLKDEHCHCKLQTVPPDDRPPADLKKKTDINRMHGIV